jgi:phosphotransferase system enzyme I (PtsI)
MNNIKIQGVTVSKGKALGFAYILNENNDFEIPKYISTFDLEQARLGQAIQLLKLEINHLKELSFYGNELSTVLNSYFKILEDSKLLKRALIKIRDESINAEWALKTIASELNSVDLRDVAANLTCLLLKKKIITIRNFAEQVILVVRDLTFIQALSMNPKNILGVLIETSIVSKETIFLTRTLAIPAVAGLPSIITIIKNGDKIAIEGDSDSIVINPNNGSSPLDQKKKIS